MRTLGRVVWRDGMHLSQHHFQAQSRYFEELIRFVAGALNPDLHGLAGYEFDDEALRNDVLSLVHARGLMPDGTPFDFPGEPLPEPLSIGDLFSPTQDSHLLLLGIPVVAEGRPNLESSSNGVPVRTRYLEEQREIIDEAAGVDLRPVSFGRKNFRLLLDVEDNEGLVTLPLARIRRDGSGHFVYDAAFIPPSLHIGAAPPLLRLLERLVTTLASRSEQLGFTASGESGEASDRWLAHALRSSIATLEHLRNARQAHPADLFAEMSRLAGALCTFSMDAHPRHLPLYDHAAPSEPFQQLAQQIETLLQVVAPTNILRYPLRPAADSIFTAAIDDPRAFGGAEWFLAVQSPIDAAALTGQVPRLVNICSAKHIQRLVREAIPGMTPTYALTPPAGLAARPGTTYFAIPRTGPCWTSIVDTQEIGLYLPASLGELQMEIVIALSDGSAGWSRQLPPNIL